jgi:hypothetical protein
LIDTGSTGLRIQNIDPSLALPAVTDASGNILASCRNFDSDAYMWGSVRTADIRIGTRTIASVPIHTLNDSALPSSAPCASNGINAGTGPDKNAILGISVRRTDCGADCIMTPALQGNAGYYACTSGSCVGTTVPLSKQVTNPITLADADNNGHVITIPQVPPTGAPTLFGTLTLGIGTKPNNQLDQATVYRTSSVGGLRHIYNGIPGFAVIDSGTPSIAIPDATIPRCTGSDFYCPPVPVTRSITINSANETTAGTASFSIVNRSSVRVAGTAAGSTAQFMPADFVNLGFPFFFGKTIFTALDGASTPAGTGPFVAFQSASATSGTGTPPASSVVITSPPTQPAGTSPSPTSTASTSPITGTSSGRCVFPDDRASDGSRCGARASSVRPGG